MTTTEQQDQAIHIRLFGGCHSNPIPAGLWSECAAAFGTENERDERLLYRALLKYRELSASPAFVEMLNGYFDTGHKPVDVSGVAMPLEGRDG